MPKITLADDVKIFEVDHGEVLYDALDNRGCTLPHGCLSGSCGACRVDILEGAENLTPPGVVEADTINSLKEEFVQEYGEAFIQNKTIRLSCRARIQGDVTLRPIK